MKALIIYNPVSNKGMIEKKLGMIKERLLLKYDKVDAMKTVSSQHAEDVARVNSSKYDLIVACGGDGTVHFVSNGIVKSGDTNVKLGILPLGTCNDVARTLHIPRKLNKAIDVLLRGESVQYDMIFDGDNYEIYTVAFGLFVNASFNTSKKSKKVWGRIAYIFKGFWSIFRIKPLPLTIETADFKDSGDYVQLLLLNAYSTAGFYINGTSNINDGVMELVMIKHQKGFLSSVKGLFTVLGLFIFGLRSVKKFKNVIIVKTDKVTIENHFDAPFTADGEQMNFLKKSFEIQDQINILQGRKI